MFQRSLPSFSVFLTYGFKNLGQEVGHCCLSNFSSLCEPSWSDKLFHVVGVWLLISNSAQFSAT